MLLSHLDYTLALLQKFKQDSKEILVLIYKLSCSLKNMHFLYMYLISLFKSLNVNFALGIR